jgi:hypothetical protein
MPQKSVLILHSEVFLQTIFLLDFFFCCVKSTENGFNINIIIFIGEEEEIKINLV